MMRNDRLISLEELGLFYIEVKMTCVRSQTTE